MSNVHFDVKVKQSWKESYYDSEKKQEVQYDNSNEIRGRFYDWEQVEVFSNNILRNFDNATIEIKIVREVG